MCERIQPPQGVAIDQSSHTQTQTQTQTQTHIHTHTHTHTHTVISLLVKKKKVFFFYLSYLHLFLQRKRWIFVSCPCFLLNPWIITQTWCGSGWEERWEGVVRHHAEGIQTYMVTEWKTWLRKEKTVVVECACLSLDANFLGRLLNRILICSVFTIHNERCHLRGQLI